MNRKLSYNLCNPWFDLKVYFLVIKAQPKKACHRV